jgi:hypothetical protein
MSFLSMGGRRASKEPCPFNPRKPASPPAGRQAGGCRSRMAADDHAERKRLTLDATPITPGQVDKAQSANVISQNRGGDYQPVQWT